MRGLRFVLVLSSAELDRINGAVALADGDGETVGVARVNNKIVTTGGDAKGCQSRGSTRKSTEILEADHIYDYQIAKEGQYKEKRRFREKYVFKCNERLENDPKKQKGNRIKFTEYKGVV